MKLGGLSARARSLGVSDGELDAAQDTDSPKEAVIALILSRMEPQPVDPRLELEGMRLGALSARARSLGVTPAELDAAQDEDVPKEAVIRLILARAPQPEPPLEPEPEPDYYGAVPSAQLRRNQSRAKAVWEWDDSPHGWKAYHHKTNEELESCFARDPNGSCTFSAQSFRNRSYDYTVQFGTMRQSNAASRKQRAVRRRVVTSDQPDRPRGLVRVNSGRMLDERSKENGMTKWRTVVSNTEGGVEILFNRLDADGDGSITSAELKQGVPDLTDADVEDMIFAVDRDGDNAIDLDEIRSLQYLERDAIRMSQRHRKISQDRSAVRGKMEEVEQLRHSLRAVLEEENPFDGRPRADSEISEDSVDSMRHKWEMVERVQRQKEDVQSQIDAQRAAGNVAVASLQKQLFELDQQIESLVSDASGVEASLPVLTHSAAQSVRLQPGKSIEWTWGKSLSGLQWHSGAPDQIIDMLRRQERPDRLVLIRWTAATGNQQQTQFDNISAALDWIKVAAAPAGPQQDDALLSAHMDDDVVDVRIQPPGFEHAEADMGDVGNWDSAGPGGGGDGDAGLVLRLDGGHLQWFLPTDRSRCLGSLDPCLGIRRIRHIIGFAGRQAAPDGTAGRWVFVGLRGEKDEKKTKLEWWMNALGNYMPGPMVGVSLEFLKRFISQRAVSKDATTEWVNFELVKPASAASGPMGLGSAYIDMLRGKSGREIGPSTVFVSHAWKYPFYVLVQAIEAWQREDPRQRDQSFYWIDIFCKNQHDVVPDEIDAEFLSSIRSAWDQYAMSPTLLFVVHPWPDPVALTRIWCLFELQTALMNASKIHFSFSLEGKAKFEATELASLLQMPMWNPPTYQMGGAMESFPAYGTWKHATRCVDVEKAEATKPSDIAMIMVGIEALEPVADANNAAFDGRELGGVARESLFLDWLPVEAVN